MGPDQRVRWLRGTIIVQMWLLAVQYELGVAVTVASGFPDVASSGFSLGTFATYVGGGGGSLVVHTIVGVVLLANAALVFGLSLPIQGRAFRLSTFVALVFVLSSALGGLLFVLSGFRDDSFSYEMSTGFIVALVFTFLSLYLMKGPSPPSPASTPA